MKVNRSLLLLCCLPIGCALLRAAPGQYLTPACTEAAPYTFADVTATSYTFPAPDTYPEWSIYNAEVEASEVSRDYPIAEIDGVKALRFTSGLVSDENAYLALGIRAENSNTAAPLSLVPATAADRFRVDNLYAKVKFVPSAELPDVDSLKEMYPRYAERQPEGGILPKHQAAKLGVCVLQDGYFYISRVMSGTPTNPGTGTPESLNFGFCKSKYTYDDVGGGAVIIRIEFRTFRNSEYESTTRAFRIFARNAADGSQEVCLTEGRGYRWCIEETGSYAFDFSSLEQDDECQWLYAFDNAVAVTDPGNFADDGSLDSLQQLGFSATEGAFYSAWLDNAQIVAGASLANTYLLGSFAPFVTTNGARFELYADWARTYNVDLTDYLVPSASGEPLLLTASAEPTETITEQAFNAFLLDMDPAAEATYALTITGIVPAADGSVTLTVCGPEGSTLAKNADVCVRRAATLEDVAGAEAITVSTNIDAAGRATLTLPATETPQPFMQAVLVPKGE
ncbi:MAG: hypothetical protein MSB12_07300 [Lentisphaeraceae bacterium]|nr:hypothetical protein [Lentisphaeraceae bacterium]